MKTRYLLAAFAIAAPALLAGQTHLPVGALKFSEPSRIAEIDTDKLKGQPSKLAWSPDGTQLYVQMLEGQFGRPEGSKIRHYVFAISDGKGKDVQGEPEWLSAYWTDKSGQASPDAAGFKIDLKSEVRTEKTVSTPMGGDLARGGTAGDDGGKTGAGDVLAAAYNQQAVPVNTMLLHGEIVGEFVNSVIVPGLTFGWGPRGSGVIAYSAGKGGRVMVMDASGRKQEVPGTKDTLLPAWSPEGSKLAWLQKDGRKKFILQVAGVAK